MFPPKGMAVILLSLKYDGINVGNKYNKNQFQFREYVFAKLYY